MVIDLNAQDIIMAAHYAGVIAGVKSTQLNAGQVRNNRIANHTDFATHYIGSLGEVAVSKALFIPIKTEITVGGDANVDMTHHGQTIQIKTSTHAVLPEGKRYLIFNNREEFSADWAILCSIQSPAVVKIHGFISQKKFLLNSEQENFGYGIRCVVSEKHLTNIDRFHEAISHAKLPQRV